jgi:hypothetical protein
MLRQSCKEGNGSPFRERSSICPKENRGTCLAEVRGVKRGADFPRCNEKREHIERADVRLPTWDPGGFLMTCDLDLVGRFQHRFIINLCAGICAPKRTTLCEFPRTRFAGIVGRCTTMYNISSMDGFNTMELWYISLGKCGKYLTEEF